MQQLDAVTLQHLARELNESLAGAKISKVQHPSAYEFLIAVWGGPPREHNLFYIHLNAEAPFCALVDGKSRQDITKSDFEKPTALCMLLRKHLGGANIQEVRSLPGERVLDVVFENHTELGNRVRLVLSLELMGKHTNMILYDDVSRQIMAVAHGVSERMSSHRELSGGLPYVPPPRPAGKKLLNEFTAAEFRQLMAQQPDDMGTAQWLNQHVYGWGVQMLSDVLQHETMPDAIYTALQAVANGERMEPSLNRAGERFTLVPPTPGAEPEICESVNEMVAAHFLTHVGESRLKQKRQQLQAALDKQCKKTAQREKELVPIADAEIEQLQATGDRILAAVSARELPEPGSVHKGSVSLTHYESGEPWVIEIDPSVSWVENAQLYYRRARKAKARKEAYQQMSSVVDAEKNYLAELLQWVRQAEKLDELEAVAADLVAAGYLRDRSDPAQGKNKTGKGKTGKGGKPAKPGKASLKAADIPGILITQASSGAEILIGKSGQANEAIVGKLARPEDWWLHVHLMPGSHVLVRSPEGELPDQTLLEAANLAVWYSSARESLNVPVIYTQIKFVRKIPQSYPGHVNYRQEKTVFITPDPVLLAQLGQLSGAATLG